MTPGGEIALTCHVRSNVAYSITWSRVDGQQLDNFRLVVHIQLKVVCSVRGLSEKGKVRIVFPKLGLCLVGYKAYDKPQALNVVDKL